MVTQEPEAADRLDRIESSLAISQLPSRYAMALDARDLDGLAALFVDDVEAGAAGRGREALKLWYDGVLRRFYRSIHLICGHRFDFIDADHAEGSVYCRAEHEVGDGWFVITMRYDDVYVRRGGIWSFVKRREHPWYSVDVTERQARNSFDGPPTFRFERPCRSGCRRGGRFGRTATLTFLRGCPDGHDEPRHGLQITS
jgi:SnoaL-like protein